jgi:hypothetical protein
MRRTIIEAVCDAVLAVAAIIRAFTIFKTWFEAQLCTKWWTIFEAILEAITEAGPAALSVMPSGWHPQNFYQHLSNKLSAMSSFLLPPIPLQQCHSSLLDSVSQAQLKKEMESSEELPSSAHSPKQLIFETLLDSVTDAFHGTFAYAKLIIDHTARWIVVVGSDSCWYKDRQ